MMIESEWGDISLGYMSASTHREPLSWGSSIDTVAITGIDHVSSREQASISRDDPISDMPSSCCRDIHDGIDWAHSLWGATREQS